MYSPHIIDFSWGLGSVLNIKSIEQDVPTYFNMKSKLAVFDFDLTIRDPDPGNDWSYGVGHLFPGGKLPEELIEIRKKHGSKALKKTLIPLVNKMGLTKKELEDCFAYKNGSIIDKMDEVLKVLYDDHDIVMITGNSRAYTDNFLKRYGLFELFEEIFANPETITDQGKVHTYKLQSLSIYYPKF